MAIRSYKEVWLLGSVISNALNLNMQWLRDVCRQNYNIWGSHPSMGFTLWFGGVSMQTVSRMSRTCIGTVRYTISSTLVAAFPEHRRPLKLVAHSPHRGRGTYASCGLGSLQPTPDTSRNKPFRPAVHQVHIQTTQQVYVLFFCFAFCFRAQLTTRKNVAARSHFSHGTYDSHAGVNVLELLPESL